MDDKVFAITYTVRDEWEILRHVIPYYLERGASRIYLFWDGTADSAPEEIKRFPNVEARRSVNVSDLCEIPDWIRVLDPASVMDHRKRINTLFAAALARRDGIEWLGCVDPDEIVLPDEESTTISDMLGRSPSSCDQILVPNLELLPMPAGPDQNMFVMQRLFLLRQDRMARLWRYLNAALRCVLAPNFRSRIENDLYRIANHGVFPPVMQNPMNGRYIYRSLFLGYNNFKPFIRTASARFYNYNIHKWQAIDRPIRSVKNGRLLHYDLPSVEYFLKKFRQRDANTMIQAFDTRYQIGTIAREAGIDIARDFYNGQICCPDTETAEKLISAGIAIRIDDVAKFFESRERTLIKAEVASQ